MDLRESLKDTVLYSGFFSWHDFFIESGRLEDWLCGIGRAKYLLSVCVNISPHQVIACAGYDFDSGYEGVYWNPGTNNFSCRDYGSYYDTDDEMVVLLFLNTEEVDFLLSNSDCDECDVKQHGSRFIYKIW